MRRGPKGARRFKKRNIEHTKQKKVANKAINQEKNL